MLLAITGIAAGVLQLAGYIVYFRQTLSTEIRPNGMSWFMWAYGTFVIFFIEFDLSAPWTILVLPTLCSISGIAIAIHCFRKNSFIRPERSDYYALAIDVILMVTYLVLIYLVSSTLIHETNKEFYGLIILVSTSLSTLVTFYPMVRTTYQNPTNERPLAWIIWSFAYAFLLFTVLAEGLSFEYAIYPILNLLLHGAVGCLSFRNILR